MALVTISLLLAASTLTVAAFLMVVFVREASTSLLTNAVAAAPWTATLPLTPTPMPRVRSLDWLAAATLIFPVLSAEILLLFI